jgi:dethiobiotin synthetase
MGMSDVSRSEGPRVVVAVVGTGTEVGKTWVSCAALASLRSLGWSVAARKPLQSFEPGDTTDAALLAAATGEDPEVVCAPDCSFEVALAPPMAAAALGVHLMDTATVAEAVASSWGGRAPDIGFIELVGGVCSPTTSNGDGLAVLSAVQPDLVVVVADPTLGTINSVRLSVMAVAAAVTAPIIVMVNRFDPNEPLHVANREWLRDVDHLSVETSAEDLAAVIAEMVPRWCGSCGRPASECDRQCVRPLEPDRFCECCGRRLIVAISPTGHSARCRVHGPTDG